MIKTIITILMIFIIFINFKFFRIKKLLLIIVNLIIIKFVFDLNLNLLFEFYTFYLERIQNIIIYEMVNFDSFNNFLDSLYSKPNIIQMNENMKLKNIGYAVTSEFMFNLEIRDKNKKLIKIYEREHEETSFFLHTLDYYIGLAQKTGKFDSSFIKTVSKSYKSMFFNYAVINHYVMPVTIRAYGMIVLLTQVNMILYSMLFLVLTSVFIVIENFNFFLRTKVRQLPPEHESFLDACFILFTAGIISCICYLSLAQLYSADSINEFPYEIGVFVGGHQWYWTYSYLEMYSVLDNYQYNGSCNVLMKKNYIVVISFTSILDVSVNFNRLLVTDNSIVSAVQIFSGFFIESSDVIHSWSLPNFGIKQDAIPGRSIIQVFKPEMFGEYSGQCSELCGINHAFMPINIITLNYEHFMLWYAENVKAIRFDNCFNYILKYVVSYKNTIFENNNIKNFNIETTNNKINENNEILVYEMNNENELAKQEKLFDELIVKYAISNSEKDAVLLLRLLGFYGADLYLKKII